MDRHRQTPWHALKLTEIYETLHTSEEGLGDAEAAERLEKYGRNALRSKPPKTILQMLKAQIIDPMVLILIGAAAFSAILQEWTEAAVIFFIFIVHAVIGIVEEKKTQSSLEAPRNISAPTTRVLRQGEESGGPATDLVGGGGGCARRGGGEGGACPPPTHAATMKFGTCWPWYASWPEESVWPSSPTGWLRRPCPPSASTPGGRKGAPCSPSTPCTPC